MTDREKKFYVLGMTTGLLLSALGMVIVLFVSGVWNL